jgi:hypothetical protein
MKKFSIILIVLLFVYSCTRKEEKVIIPKNLPTYHIKVDANSFFNWDKYINKVDIIPLETTNNSLVGFLNKGIVRDSNIFILDYKLHSLLNFDLSGNFLGKIGKRGQGPNEYLEIRDFTVSDSSIYILDYKEIHSYDIKTKKHKISWSIFHDKAFNPSNFIIISNDHYYLWASNPDIWDKDKKKHYRLKEIKNKKVKEEYFEYKYKSSDDPRFYLSGDNCYIKPIDGDYILYKLKEDSIFASFALDFGKLALSAEEINRLRNSKEKNAYLKSNHYKSISNVYEIGKFIYFNCIGPESIMYEGLINTHTGQVVVGKWDYKKSPRFFFSDGTYLYAYYEPFTLSEKIAEKERINLCFNSAFDALKKIDISNNIVIVRYSLKNEITMNFKK